MKRSSAWTPVSAPLPHHTNIPQRGLSPRREALSLAVLKVWRGGGVAREAVSKYGGSRWRQGVEGAVCCSSRSRQVERAGGRRRGGVECTAASTSGYVRTAVQL
jgi:hypothetical protein